MKQITAGVIMFEQDRKRFAALMVSAGEVYNKPLTSALIGIYWSVLKAYSFEDIDVAVKCHLVTPDVGKFFPKPADIIMAIKGSPQNQALLAWSKVVSAMRSAGRYTSIAFDDALIHKVIGDMDGWVRFCNIDEKQLPFIEKEFLERYRGYTVNIPTSYPPYLIGIIESQNRIYGYMYDPPALIGNTEKAKQVMATGQMPFLVKELLLPENTNKISCKN